TAACADFRNTSTTPPSALTNPSASAENARHRPLGDSIEACEKEMKVNGLAMTLMPPTIAVSMRPARNASSAWCKATSEEEQAVSTVKLGPCKLNMYEIRFEIVDSALPGAKCASAAAGSA